MNDDSNLPAKITEQEGYFLLVPLHVFAALPWLLYPDTTEPDSAYMVTEVSVFNVLICCKGYENDQSFVNEGGI